MDWLKFPRESVPTVACLILTLVINSSANRPSVSADANHVGVYLFRLTLPFHSQPGQTAQRLAGRG